MQGGGEEELLRFTADTSGVIGPLEQVVTTLDAVDLAIKKMGGGTIIDGDALAKVLRTANELGDGLIRLSEAAQRLRGTFTTLGMDLTRYSDAANAAIDKQIMLADSFTQLGRAELEQQRVLLTGLQTQVQAVSGVVELGDALNMTAQEQANFGRQTLAALQTMRDQAVAAGADAEALVRFDEAMAQAAGTGAKMGNSLLTAGDAVRHVGDDALVLGADIERGIYESFNSAKVTIDSMKVALEEMAAAGTVSAEELAAALRLVNQLWVGVGTATTQAVAPAKEAANALSIEKTSVQDLAAELSKLSAAFASNVFDKTIFMADGLAAKDLAAGLTDLLAKADAFSAAQSVLKSAADGDAAALEKVNAAALMAAQGLDKATLASSATATKMVADAQAEADAAAKATTAQRGFFDQIAQGVNEYMAMFMAVQMVGQAISSFIALGAGIDHTFNIIQGATQVSDAQMQQWSTDLSNLGDKYGVLQTDATSALDLISRAGFAGADATKVEANAMQLANTTGSKMADTTALLTTALNVYGFSADQAHMVTQNLYSAFESSTLSMSQFESFLQTSGLDAKNLGISIQDLLTTFADVGNKIGGGNIALREFQAILGGLTTFSNLTADQLNKLANGFDLAKFSAADASLKMLDLAKAANGNESAFTKMIGGMNNAQSVIDNLGISTHQLAVNAANLGLSFDPVIYNSLDAAGKLQYLADVSGYTDSKFKALTKGGLESVNAALVSILPAIDAAGKHLAAMSPEFDMAKFKSEDLAQKLHQVADFVGGTGTKAFADYVGGAKNVGPALVIMGQEADNTGQKMSKAAADTAAKTAKAAADFARANDTMRTHMADASGKIVDSLHLIDQANAKTANDVATKTTAMSSAWQHAANSFVQLFASPIAGALNGLANELNFMSANQVQTVVGFLLPWYGIPAAFGHIFGEIGPTIGQGIYYGIDAAHTAVTTFVAWLPVPFQAALQGIYYGIDAAHTAVTNFVSWLPQVFSLAMQQIGQSISSGFSTILGIVQQGVHGISNWFVWLAHNLVGGSVVPEMTSAIVAKFQNMKTQANTETQQLADGVTNKFQTLSDKAIAILQQMGGQLATQWGSMDQNTIAYWNNIADYVDKQATKLDAAATARVQHLSTGLKKNFQDASDVTQQTVGEMAAAIPNQLANMDTQITSTFKNLGTQIGQDFSDIKTNADTTFQAMVDSINSKATTLRTKVMAAIDGLKKDMHTDFLNMQTDATTQADTLSTNVQNSYNKMQGLVSGIVTNLLAVLRSDWGIAATDAWTGGVNTGSSFAAGLNSQAGAVANAAANLAAQVSNNMPHSPAKEGPLMHADQFMPSFVHMLATGITNNLGELRTASMAAAQSIGSGLNLSSSSPSMGMGGSMSMALQQQQISLLRQIVSQGAIGRPALPANLGSVTQQFGSVNFNSNMSPQQLYAQLNKLSGLALEDANRGATFGMGY